MSEVNPTTPDQNPQEPYYEDETYLKYVSSELSHKRGVFVKMSYLKLVGYDFTTAFLLAQIIYWFLPDKNNRIRVRVYRDGHYWIAKRRTDWEEEIGISARQYDRSIRILERLGVVEVRLMKFNGVPTPHIRVVWDKFVPAVEAIEREMLKEERRREEEGLEEVEQTVGVSGFYAGGEAILRSSVKSTSRASVKSLTKTTNKDYNIKNTTNAPKSALALAEKISTKGKESTSAVPRGSPAGAGGASEPQPFDYTQACKNACALLDSEKPQERYAALAAWYLWYRNCSLRPVIRTRAAFNNAIRKNVAAAKNLLEAYDLKTIFRGLTWCYDHIEERGREWHLGMVEKAILEHATELPDIVVWPPTTLPHDNTSFSCANR